MKFDLLLDGQLYKIEVGTTGDLAVRIDGDGAARLDVDESIFDK